MNPEYNNTDKKEPSKEDKPKINKAFVEALKADKANKIAANVIITK